MDWCMKAVRQLTCNLNEILASGQWVHILPYHAVSYLIPTPPSLVTDSSPASHVRNLLLVDKGKDLLEKHQIPSLGGVCRTHSALILIWGSRCRSWC